MVYYTVVILIVGLMGCSASWNNPASAQYHIQTDEGAERYFRYQTLSGQYRKEKRLEDGTVIGTYAWIDDAGFLRQRDYIADSAGYRILKTKNLYVGRNTPIAQAIKAAKKTAASAGTLVKTAAIQPSHPTPYVEISPHSVPSTTPAPTLLGSTLEPPYSSDFTATPATLRNASDLSTYYLPAGTLSLSTPQPPPTPPTESPFSINPWFYSSASQNDNPALYSGAPQYENNKKSAAAAPLSFHNGPTYPVDTRGQAYTGHHNQIGNGYNNAQYDLYDGVSVTNDGFRYYIPRAYHEEQSLPGDKKSGSFGYIDPFGIRRVIYYNAAPGTGFLHRKNNRYVGFDATPYDPRPYYNNNNNNNN